MGFNLAGILINKPITKTDIETLLGSKIEVSGEVDFEEAVTDFREENTVDILQTELGTLIITELAQVYDLSISSNDIVQFMISDVSDTYYFQKHVEGTLVRKFISSQGEISENIGNGILLEEEDFADQVWNLADEYLGKGFTENMYEMKLIRYTL